MAFTFVQRGGAGNSSPTLTITAGSSVVVFVEWWDVAVTVTALTGNGNTWVHPGSAHANNGGGVLNTDVFYVLTANSGSTSVTPTWSSGSPSGGYALHMIELAPAGTPSIGNITTAFSGTNVTASTSDLTTNNANEAICSANMNASTDTLSPSGWATQLKTTGAFFEYSSYLANAGGAGSKTINWDFQGNTTYAQTNIALIDSGGGGGQVTHNTRSHPLGVKHGYARRVTGLK